MIQMCRKKDFKAEIFLLCFHSLFPNFLRCLSFTESHLLCLCFSLSEPQHLRKTHHRPQHDDVICWVPAGSKPVHRWQCCASEILHEPCQPSSPQTVAEFMASHWIIAVIDSCLFHLCFCPLLPLRFVHSKKNKVNIELGH